MVLKLGCISGSAKTLVEMQIAGSYPQSLLFSRSWLGTETSHFFVVVVVVVKIYTGSLFYFPPLIN